jgi:LmbE family N-acetylglucosaminyl deacetylase
MKNECNSLGNFYLLFFSIVLANCHVAGAESSGTLKPVIPSNESQVIAALKQANRVLWLAAHPDDETSSSALLARAKDLAGNLYMVSLTSGENSDTVWGGLRRGSEIGAARAKLFAQSAALLRADGFEVGPFVNGPMLRAELDSLPSGLPHKDWTTKATSKDVIEKWKKEGDPLGYLVAVLRKLHPDVVITMDYHCGVSGHGEHLAVGRLLLQALPLAADANTFPEAGGPWKVRHVIFNASVTPQLVACQYCKCEGEDLSEPIENLFSLESSSRFGMTYFGVTCLVARTYESAMKDKGLTEQEIRTGCEQADRTALRAAQEGKTNQWFSQLLRVRSFP